jgi:hypothetical protein
MLRFCAFNLYGWKPDHEDLSIEHQKIAAWKKRGVYPKSWPKHPNERLPRETVALSQQIRDSAEKRLSEIRRDLREPGQYYPKKQVRAALKYWKIVP